MINRIAADIRYFSTELAAVLFRGGLVFFVWMSFLTIFAGLGAWFYFRQLQEGLVLTNIREQVTWGLYISNFTFLVGVAAAAVILIIPAYLYHFKDIKKIVVLGELLAVTAVAMAILFVLADMGRPERLWHAIPGLGSLNFPRSILGWDMVVLIGYLFLNLFTALFIGVHRFYGMEADKRIVLPLILISIPAAVAVHTVTAFVYNGLAARSFWNASILAPRFLASAFCSGPALMIILFQILRKRTAFTIENKSIFRIAEIMAYAMAMNLFLLLAEVFKEYYSDTMHLAPMQYLFTGLHGHHALVPYIWTAMVFNVAAFLIFLVPKTRENLLTLNMGCALVIIGVWIEKGMGLIVPGFIPDAYGEIYEYLPSRTEIMVSIGILSAGAMLYTLFIRFVIAIDTGRLRHPAAPPIVDEGKEGLRAKDIMKTKVISIRPSTPVSEIGGILVAHRISAVPVVDSGNVVIGVVSESDIIYQEIHDAPELRDKIGGMILPGEVTARKVAGNTAVDIMTSPAITAPEDAPLNVLIKTITEKKIKRIIIVDKERHAVGIVSRIDVVKALEYL